MAPPDLAPRLLLQERQEGHIPDHDNTKPLCMAVQGQDHTLHGQVSSGKVMKTRTYVVQRRAE